MFIHEIRTLVHYTRVIHAIFVIYYYAIMEKQNYKCVLLVITVVYVCAHCMQVTNCGVYHRESSTKCNYNTRGMMAGLFVFPLLFLSL